MLKEWVQELRKLEFEERPNEAFTVFAADKTEPGAFNYPFYRLFVDAISNTGLIVNKSLAQGVKFNVMDVEKAEIAELVMWEDKPTLEACINVSWTLCSFYYQH